MKLSQRIESMSEVQRRWLSIVFTNATALLLSMLCIYGFTAYGLALFILIPVYIGFTSTTIYCYKSDRTRPQALGHVIVTISTFSLLLILFALEGAMCILMTAPLAIFIGFLGAFIAFEIVGVKSNKSTSAILFLFVSVPTTGAIENQFPNDTLTKVSTQVEIRAPIEIVWKNVIEFPELPPPDEFLFRAGISYPINAKIRGTGVGAIRYCNFSTGSFKEPITIWNEPTLLQFDVEESPAPMRELSFWDIDAPHLHDFFASKKGQFKLKRIGADKTLLIGTTWYNHKIRPTLYWNLWSNYIIHKIHTRVLNHIKKTSEKKS